MAKKVVLDFEISGVKQQVKTFMELKEAISDSKKQLESVEFGSADFEKQKTQIQELEKAYRSLGKTAEDTAQEEIDAADKAAKAQGDSTKEKRESIMGAADDFEKFAKGIVDAVSGIAIAMGASDEDTKAMMESFMKFQGIATAVKGGIESVIVVVKNWAAIQRVLNLVLVANPIGLIIVGVAALAAGIYLLIKNIDSVIEVFSDWKNIVLALLGPLGWILIAMNEINKSEEELDDTRKQTARNAQKIYKDRLNQIDAEKEAFVKAKDEEIYAMQLEKETLEANGEASDVVTLKILEAEKEKVKATLDANTQKLQSAIDYFSFLAKLSGQSEEKFKKELKARGVDLERQQEEFEAILQKNADAVQRSENNITEFKREQEEERTDDAQERSDKAKELYEREMIAFLQLQIDMSTGEQERLSAQIKLLEFQADWRIKNEELTASEIKLINEQLKTDILSLHQEIIDSQVRLSGQKVERIKTDLNTEKKETKSFWESMAEMGAKAAQDAADKRAQDLKDSLDNANAKIATVEHFVNAASSLTNSLFTLTNNLGKQDEASQLKRAKRQFQIKKGLDIVEAGINGAKAITQAIAQFGPPPSPLGIAGIASAAVITGAQIAAIASKKFDPGSSGGGSSSAGASFGGAAGSAPTGSSGSPQFNPQTLYAAGANTNNITPFKSGANEVGPAQPVVIQNNISLSEINSGNATLTNLMAATTI